MVCIALRTVALRSAKPAQHADLCRPSANGFVKAFPGNIPTGQGTDDRLTRMRILHVIDHLGLGGAQTTLADLLSAWPEPGDALHVMSLGRKTDLAPRFESINGLHLQILGRRRWDFRSMHDLVRVIEDQKIDVLHAHLAKSICASLWMRPRIPARVVVHAHCDPQREPWVLRRATSRWRQRIDAIIAVSRHTQRELTAWYRTNCPPLHMVYNAFGSPSQGPQEPILVRRRLGIAPDTFLLGFAGRLTRQKGLRYLISALQLMRGENVALVIIGDGPLRARLRHQVQQAGLTHMVHFVGSQSQVWPWLREMDAGILPSLYEGLPTTAVELMISGKPVIATAVNGTPEVVRDGHTGILVPSRDPAALARAIRRLARDRRLSERLGQGGAQLAHDMFSPGGSGQAVRDVYAGVLS